MDNATKTKLGETMSISIIQLVWPQWTLVEQLGKGSYGTVYKAVRKDSRVNATAAIKVIAVPQDKSEHETLLSEGMTQQETRTYFKGIVDDFVEEIALMETFKGMQNIVSIEDYQVVENPETDGWLILVRMELLTPFVSYMVDHKMTEEEVIRFGIDLCTALEFCNTQNIIHRDIKPENIFVNKFGSFKLGDFGIAKRFESMTASHSQKGTFNYMAPEVANGTHYDARVDIYSLGIVLYRLLNQNNLPFINAENRMSPVGRKQALEKRLSGEPLPAPSEASDAMAKVILKACANRPADRFIDATEFKTALEAVKAGTLDAVWSSHHTLASEGMEDNDRTVSLKTEKAVDSDTTIALRGRKRAKYPETQMIKADTETPKKKKAPKALIFGSVALLIVCLIALVWGISRFRDQKAKDPTPKETDSVTTASTTVIDTSPNKQSAEEKVQLEKAVVGDVVYFGNNNWLVLAKEEDRILLITQDTVGALSWGNSLNVQKWEHSSIRDWLETTFIGRFDSEEASRIIPLYFSSDDTIQFDDPENKYTHYIGRIFLLSKAEVQQYMPFASERRTKGELGWWLRTPTPLNLQGGWYIMPNGSLKDVSPETVGGIRPAIWVSLTEHYDNVEYTTRVDTSTTEAPTRRDR